MWVSRALAGLLLAGLSGLGAAASPVRIGVLEGAGPLDRQLAAGAALAAAEINAAGGVEGRPLELFRMAPARPWRQFAGRAAALVFEHDISALIGPSDGAAAHVAAQIATRKRIPLLALSSEGNLTRVADPWIFRGVPDDEEQAGALLEWAFPDPRGKRALIVVPPDRAGRERRAHLEKVCRELGLSVIAALDSEPLPPTEADVLLLWLDPDPALQFLSGRDGEALPEKVLGPLWLEDPRVLERLPAGAPQIAVPSLGRQREGGVGLALGYDMVAAVAEAAAQGGSDPAAIRTALSRGLSFTGRSGTFSFDSHGNRRSETSSINILERSGAVRALAQIPKQRRQGR